MQPGTYVQEPRNLDKADVITINIKASEPVKTFLVNKLAKSKKGPQAV